MSDFCEDDTYVLGGDQTDVVLPEETLGKRLLESLKQAPENCVAMVSFMYIFYEDQSRHLNTDLN